MTFQICMYFLSFSPLWVSVLFMDLKSLLYDKTNAPWTERISIVGIVLCFVISFFVMRSGLKAANAQNKKQAELVEAKEEKFLIAEFLMAYIFPLFAFDFTKWYGAVLFLIFFGIFGWQCVSHQFLCVNVILDILKYKIFDCKLDIDGAIIEKKVVSKRPLRNNTSTQLVYTSINNDYVIDILLS